MIRARTIAKNGGKPGLLLGLSRENCKRLLEGKPILFEASTCGLGDVLGTIIIVGGETEDSIAAELKEMWTGDVTVEDHRGGHG